jgi:2-phosphosulfolactate phosphatase
MPESPFDQRRYQVRFEWGARGLARLERADVVVVVDVLRFSTTVTDAVARGETVPLDEAAHAVSLNGAAVAAAAANLPAARPGTANPAAADAAADGVRPAQQDAGVSGPVVMLGCLRNARAVAHAILAEQHRRGDRTSIAIIAAGELTGREPGAALRFAIEDQLGAGAIVDALGGLGVDHTSPEAAAASEAFRGLRGAMRHLLTASGSGQELIDGGRRNEVLGAAALDAASVVPVLRDRAFVAY